MNPEEWRRHRLTNALQSMLLLAGMALILAGLGWVVGGVTGVIWALAGGVVLVLLNPGVSPRLMLRLYGARPLGPRQAPGLNRLLSELAKRAGLPAVPELWYVPSQVLNAFAVGSRTHSAIALSDALLRALAPRELAGVLAHEVSHVRNSDTWVMGLADLFSRLTSLFSTFGQVLVLVNLPLVLFSGYGMSWGAILILVFAPTVSALLQLALSRTREYDADLGAAELTGDPHGLAMALARMERYQGRFLEQILFPGRRVPDPSLLRTHPPTEERIRRLQALAQAPGPREREAVRAVLPREGFPAVRRQPRRRIHGLWY